MLVTAIRVQLGVTATCEGKAVGGHHDARKHLSTRVTSPGASLGNVGIIMVLALGVVTGGFAAFAYYNSFLRPLAHTVGIWFVLVAVVAVGRRWRIAAIRSIATLMAAVLAFYFGKKIFYNIHYPGTVYQINTGTVTLWLILAVCGGCVLGVVFSNISLPGWRGVLATSSATGLLVADATRRISSHSSESLFLGICCIFALFFITVLGRRNLHHVLRILILTIPMATLGYVLVSIPDFIEGFW